MKGIECEDCLICEQEGESKLLCLIKFTTHCTEECTVVFIFIVNDLLHTLDVLVLHSKLTIGSIYS